MTSRMHWPVVAGFALVLGGCAAGTDVRAPEETPSFSDPTRIDHPLFPAGEIHSALRLGVEDGDPLRIESTLMPETGTAIVEGQAVGVLEVQSVAIRDERLAGAAVVAYAQADDGSVWALCNDQEPALVMPAQPEVGMVFFPGGRCGIAFDEVAILEVGLTVDAPSGAVGGAILASVVRTDGTTGVVFYAPGHGEVSSGSEDGAEVLAIAVPPDAIDSTPPDAMLAISHGAHDVYRLAGNGDWGTAAARLESMMVAWSELRTTDLPSLLRQRTTDRLAALREAVAVRDRERTRHEALAVARALLDLELRHRPPVSIDVRRFDLWAAQAIIDAEHGDAAGVRSDIRLLNLTWDRFAPAFADGAKTYEMFLSDMQLAVDRQDLDGVAAIAEELRDTLDAW